MDIVACGTAYHGLYGSNETHAHILVINMACPPRVGCGEGQSHVVFLMDTSGSMRGQEVAVKTSLLTYRDLLGDNFGKCAKITIITYNSISREIWSHYGNCSADLQETLDASIVMRGNTNFDDALSMAFEKITTHSAKIPSWIVLMTDGNPTEGDNQTSEQLASFVASKHKPACDGEMLSIITLGYGASHNMEILRAIGDYTYVKDPQCMTTVLSLLSQRTFNAAIFNIDIGIPDDPYDFTVGSTRINNMSYGQTFMCGIRYPNTACVERVCASGANISYRDTSGKPHVVHVPIALSTAGACDLAHVVEYCSTRKGIGLREIENRSDIPKMLARMKTRTDRWPKTVEALTIYHAADPSQSIDDAVLAIQGLISSWDTLLREIKPGNLHRSRYAVSSMGSDLLRQSSNSAPTNTRDVQALEVSRLLSEAYVTKYALQNSPRLSDLQAPTLIREPFRSAFPRTAPPSVYPSALQLPVEA